MRIHDRFFILFAGVEYDEDIDDDEVLEGLGHDEILSVRDTTDVGRAFMFPWWTFSRVRHHPWRDFFVPWEALRTVLAQPSAGCR